MLIFWLIVIGGLSLWVYALFSERRNPSMHKCKSCRGSGVDWIEVEGPGQLKAVDCLDCDAGWVEGRAS